MAVIARIFRFFLVAVAFTHVCAYAEAQPLRAAPLVTPEDRTWANAMHKRHSESMARQVALYGEYKKELEARTTPIKSAEDWYPPAWHERFVKLLDREVRQLHQDVLETRKHFNAHNLHCHALLDEYERDVLSKMDSRYADFLAQRDETGKKVVGQSFVATKEITLFPTEGCVIDKERLDAMNNRMRELRNNMREKD
jgi:hypothetical protein